MRGKNVMISSVAGQSGGLNAQANLKSLLHAVGAVLVSETGYAHTLGKEEFMTDELQLTAEEKMSLAMEINNLILGLNGF
jgi:NAD(P)H-dependent FMN reductase